jgi:glycosyltransferase involved in cell wall biosynthesis
MPKSIGSSLRCAVMTIAAEQAPLGSEHAAAHDATHCAPLFTIFTPTYNRAHTLHRVFESLSAQTLRDFEWIIVDDGSTDGTEELAAGWAKSANFPMRHLRQNHGGKHIAHNLALQSARGKFFTCLDSDDALPPDALQKLARVWDAIPESEKPNFSGVDGLCCDQHGRIVGDVYPRDPFDADMRERKYVYGPRGEKWGVVLTEIARLYPFPQVAIGKYLPEGIVWLDMAKRFKTRAVNAVVRIYYIDDAEPGVTTAIRRRLAAHAEGNWHYYIWLLNNDLEYFVSSPKPFIKAAVMLPVVAWITGRSLGSTLQELRAPAAKSLVVTALPAAVAIFLMDRLRRPA